MIKLQVTRLLLMLLVCSITTSVKAQILYATGVNTGGISIVLRINVATCEVCEVSPVSANIGTNDIVLLPDGTSLNLDAGGIRRLEAPPSVNIIWQTGNPQGYVSGQLAPNGLVYLVGPSSELVAFNPASNTITVIGTWPASVAELGDIFYIDGVLYANGVDQALNGILVEINVSAPALSVITPWSAGYTDGEGGNWNGVEGLFFADASQQLYFYNPQDESVSTLCIELETAFAITGLTTLPAGLPESACIPACTTDAGELTQSGPFNTCVNNPFSFPAADQTDLDANDLLQYVLFTNPADTAGSIIAVSNTPQFNFMLPMQTGLTYYVAAVAGNNLNGNVDLTDICLDFSNALEVIWQPLPTIQFAAPNPDLCARDCRTLELLLSGTGSFTVAGNLVSGGNVVSTFSETFGGDTGTLILCTPAGTLPGPLLVQPTLLTDAWCICE